jgi:tetratricopeptide (TPR) repeat protein
MSNYFNFLLILTLLTSCNSSELKEAKQLNNEAVVFIEEGDFALAKSPLLKGLGLAKSEVELHAAICRNLSLSYYKLDQLDSAKHYSQRGYTESKANSFYFFLNKAEFSLYDQNYGEAILYFEKAKNIQPKNMVVYNSLAMLYSGKYSSQYKDKQKALDNNLIAFKLDPRENVIESLALSYMEMQEWQLSTPLWKRLRAKNPSKMEYAFEHGLCIYKSGYTENGMKLMEWAAEKDEYCRQALNGMKKI